MRKLALSALIMSAAAVVLPSSAAAEAKTASGHKHHMHMAKHQHWRHHASGVWYGYPAAPMAGSYRQSGGDVCPGIGRSFDCKIWPPPFEDDPDRKTTKY